MKQETKTKLTDMAKHVLLAVVVGPIVGAIDAVFGRILIAVSSSGTHM